MAVEYQLSLISLDMYMVLQNFTIIDNVGSLVCVLLGCFSLILQNEELLRILLFGVQVLEQYVSVEISSLSDEATKLLLNFVKLTSQVLNWHFCHTHRILVMKHRYLI